MPKATTKRKVMTRSKLLEDLDELPEPEPPAKAPSVKKEKGKGKKVTLSTPPDKPTLRKEPRAPRKQKAKREEKEASECGSCYIYVSTQDSLNQFIQRSQANRERRRLRDVRRGLYKHYDSPLMQSDPEDATDTIIKCPKCGRLINKADTTDHGKICQAIREQSMVTVSRYVGSEEDEEDEDTVDYAAHIWKVYQAYSNRSRDEVEAIIKHYEPHLQQLLRATVEKYGSLADTPGCYDVDGQSRMCSYAAEKQLSVDDIWCVVSEYPDAPEHGFLELQKKYGVAEVPLSVFDPANHNTLLGKVRVILAELCPERLHEGEEIVRQCRGFPDQYLRMVHESLDEYVPTPSQQQDRLVRLTKLFEEAAPELLPQAEHLVKAYEEDFEAYLYKMHRKLLQ